MTISGERRDKQEGEDAGKQRGLRLLYEATSREKFGALLWAAAPHLRGWVAVVGGR